jgi:hypothetical protein
MRIIFAFMVMGAIGFVAAVLAAISVLIQMLPFIAAVLVIAGLIRAAQRHRARSETTVLPAAARPHPPQAVSAPAQARPAQAGSPGGWVLMPVWVPDAPASAPRRDYIDGEVISTDGEHA